MQIYRKSVYVSCVIQNKVVYCSMFIAGNKSTEDMILSIPKMPE